MILRFIKEKDYNVKEQTVKVLFKKKIFQIDRHSFAHSAKNKRIIWLTDSIYQVIPLPKMANTKSAIKRIRRISKQTSVNKIRKSRYKNAIKKMNGLLEKKDKSEALKFLPKLNSELMRIAKTGVIKKQNASRNISRITKKISTI